MTFHTERLLLVGRWLNLLKGLYCHTYIYIYIYIYLVGGFKHFLYFNIYIYGMSSFPLTNSIIFQDGYCTTRRSIHPAFRSSDLLRRIRRFYHVRSVHFIIFSNSQWELSREYPQKIWPYMVLTYLHFRILKFPLIIIRLGVWTYKRILWCVL